MSRIGMKLIKLENVVFKREGDILNFSANNKTNIVKLLRGIDMEEKNGIIRVFPINNEAEKQIKANFGTTNRLINTAIKGLISPFTKVIKLVGIGYRVFLEKNKLKFQLGYSHEIFLDIDNNVEVKLDGTSTINLSSSNKDHLGKFSYKICKLRKVDVYKNKGVLDMDKKYIKKEVVKK